MYIYTPAAQDHEPTVVASVSGGSRRLNGGAGTRASCGEYTENDFFIIVNRTNGQK